MIFMLLINIDGPDCSGKSTVCKKLQDKIFESTDYNMTHVHFPRYDTEIGKVIKSVLHGEVELNPLALQMLYSADRVDFCANMLPKLSKENDIVLVDRYATSGVVYGRLDNISTVTLYDLQSNILHPHINFILDCPENVLMDRLSKRGNADKYENLENLKKSRTYYKTLKPLFLGNIEYIDSNRPIDEVVNDIYQRIF